MKGKGKVKGKIKAKTKAKSLWIRYRELLNLSEEEVAEDFLMNNQSSIVKCSKCGRIYYIDNLKCSFCENKKDFEDIEDSRETDIDIKDEIEESEDNFVYTPNIAINSDIDKLAQIVNSSLSYSFIPTDIGLYRDFLRHLLMYMRFMEEKSFVTKDIEKSHNTFFILLPEKSKLKGLSEIIKKEYPQMQKEWRKHKYERKKIEQKINIVGYINWNHKKEEIKIISTKKFAEKFGFDNQLIAKETDLFIMTEISRRRKCIFDFVTSYNESSAIKKFYECIREAPNNPEQEDLAFHYFFLHAKEMYREYLVEKCKGLSYFDFSQLKNTIYTDCIVCEIDAQEYYFPLYKFIGRKVQNKDFCSEYVQSRIREGKKKIKEELKDLQLTDDTFSYHWKKVSGHAISPKKEQEIERNEISQEKEQEKQENSLESAKKYYL